MTEVVLDASAVLALLLKESGHEQVDRIIAGALISVVNESEVVSRLMALGEGEGKVIGVVNALPYRVVELDRHLARRAGVLREVTRSQGLSLADRCCLALAEREGLPALTADRCWAELDIGIRVQMLSGRRSG